MISEKGLKPVEELKIDGSPVAYTGDVGMFISALIELHDIFELNFEMDLNEVGTKFPTIESLVEYFMIRIVDEKFNVFVVKVACSVLAKAAIFYIRKYFMIFLKNITKMVVEGIKYT